LIKSSRLLQDRLLAGVRVLLYSLHFRFLALIPFALLYVFGIKYAVRRLNSTWLPMSILAGILIFSVGSEILVNRVVFSSEYNWFHR
jgi:ABC-type uncharacterized transport system permease subunit